MKEIFANKRLVPAALTSLLIVGCTGPQDDVSDDDDFAGYPDESDDKAVPSARKCTANINRRAHQFMESDGLIRPGEELSLPSAGLEVAWTCRKIVRASESLEYVVMGLVSNLDAVDPYQNNAFEVLARHRSTGEISRFAEAPPSGPFRFAVGVCPGVLGELQPDGAMKYPKWISIQASCFATKNFEALTNYVYYIELQNEQALDALKAIKADVPYAGFAGLALQTGKAAIDQSSFDMPGLQGRDWNIAEATFDLRRGFTAEVLDIQPADLDGLKKADENSADPYAEMVFDQAYKDVFWAESPNGVEVAPWVTASVLKQLD